MLLFTGFFFFALALLFITKNVVRLDSKLAKIREEI